jgi:cytochrome P450
VNTVSQGGALTPGATASEADRIISQFASGGIEDPTPLYDEVRELGDGVHWSSTLNGWVVTRHADIYEQCMDPARFSSDFFWEMPTGIYDPESAEQRRFVEINSKQFMLKDPPDHTRLRSIFRGTFTPTSVGKWKAYVEDVTQGIVSALKPESEIDLMPTIAQAVPIAVIARILGVPFEDTHKFKHWTDAYVATFNPVIQGKERDECIHTTVTLFDYLEELVARKKAEPQDDLVSLIVTTPTKDGDILDAANAVAQIALLLVAGNETTSNLIGNTVTLLLRNPEALAQVRADHELIPNLIEESLRFEPPVKLNIRKVSKDTDFRGHEMRAGQLVFHALAAANRDPRQFEHPGRFDVTRPTKKNWHLAFSHGIHHCLGAPLARMEGAVVVRKLLERYPNFAEGSRPPERNVNAIITLDWKHRPLRLVA